MGDRDVRTELPKPDAGSIARAQIFRLRRVPPKGPVLAPVGIAAVIRDHTSSSRNLRESLVLSLSPVAKISMNDPSCSRLSQHLT